MCFFARYMAERKLDMAFCCTCCCEFEKLIQKLVSILKIPQCFRGIADATANAKRKHFLRLKLRRTATANANRCNTSSIRQLATCDAMQMVPFFAMLKNCKSDSKRCTVQQNICPSKAFASKNCLTVFHACNYAANGQQNTFHHWGPKTFLKTRK